MVNNNIYFSTASGTPSVYLLSGLPTTAVVPTAAIVLGTGASPFGMAFNSSETIAYVADDRTTSAGGIMKFVYSGGAWGTSPAYTLSVADPANTATANGARSVIADFAGTDPILYAVTQDNRLVKIVDNSAGATATTLATGPSNAFFRSVIFAPKAPKIPQAVPQVSTTASIAIYPNPVNNVVNIQASVAVDIVISDMQGNTVASMKNAAQIDMTHMASGLYFMTHSDKQGNILIHKKIIKN
jgi:hypothetical protein